MTSRSIHLWPLRFQSRSIIDSLASEDDKAFSSVKACSPVSRKFLPCTRSHKFNSIVIYSLRGLTPLMFARLISQNLEIAYYVNSLRYYPRMEDAELATESFATALSSLRRLKRLYVQPYQVLRKDLPLKEIILNLMHLPTLSHLELMFRVFHGFHVPDLALCTGLKSFKMFGSGVTGRFEEVEIYSEKPSRLESYTDCYMRRTSGGVLMQLCTTLRTDGKFMIDITGLKKLSTCVKFDGLDVLKKCFNLCTQLTDVSLFGCQFLDLHLSQAKISSKTLKSQSSIPQLEIIHVEMNGLCLIKFYPVKNLAGRAYDSSLYTPYPQLHRLEISTPINLYRIYDHCRRLS